MSTGDGRSGGSGACGSRAVPVVLLVGFLVQTARGADTQPWVCLRALGGGTYLLSVVAIRSWS